MAVREFAAEGAGNPTGVSSTESVVTQLLNIIQVYVSGGFASRDIATNGLIQLGYSKTDAENYMALADTVKAESDAGRLDLGGRTFRDFVSAQLGLTETGVATTNVAATNVATTDVPVVGTDTTGKSLDQLLTAWNASDKTDAEGAVAAVVALGKTDAEARQLLGLTQGGEQGALTPEEQMAQIRTEETQEGLGATFRQYLRNAPGYGNLGGFGRKRQEERFTPSLYQYYLNAPLTEGAFAPDQSFVDYMKTKGFQGANPRDLQQQLSGLLGSGTLTPEQQQMRQRLMEGDDENMARQMFEYANVQSTPGLFRGMAKRRFGRLEDEYLTGREASGESFLDYMRRKTGKV